MRAFQCRFRKWAKDGSAAAEKASSKMAADTLINDEVVGEKKEEEDKERRSRESKMAEVVCLCGILAKKGIN